MFRVFTYDTVTRLLKDGNFCCTYIVWNEIVILNYY